MAGTQDAKLEVLDEIREEWRGRFGGGMVPFDDAYWQAKREGRTTAEAQMAGVYAVLNRYTVELHARLDVIARTWCMHKNTRGMLCDRPPGHNGAHYYVGHGQ